MIDYSLCKLFTLEKKKSGGNKFNRRIYAASSLNIINDTFQTTPELVRRVIRVGGANSNRGEISLEFTDYRISSSNENSIPLSETKEINILKDITFHPFNTNLFE